MFVGPRTSQVANDNSLKLGYSRGIFGLQLWASGDDGPETTRPEMTAA